MDGERSKCVEHVSYNRRAELEKRILKAAVDLKTYSLHDGFICRNKINKGFVHDVKDASDGGKIF
eukprot:scaffold1577_cov79-Skeletonema_dohrnii-CCMP3373.AAC.2